MTAKSGSRSSVNYKPVDASYFKTRQLRRHAGVFTLWMMGVGAVIAGDYAGWNIGLADGGFGGLLISLLIVGFLYICLCSSIGEMSAALPHTGGAYSFARTALGPWGGYTTGLAENIEFVLAPGGNIFFLSAYLASITGTSMEWLPAWWILGYAVMLVLSTRGIELTMRVLVWITIAATLVLVFFFVIAIPEVDIAKNALNIASDGSLLPEGNGPWLPFGWTGVLATLPFAVYMFLAVEQLPLAAEEANNPTRDMPRALILSVVTLFFLAIGMLVFSASISTGSHALGSASDLLLDNFKALLGEGWARFLALAAVLGLGASFFAGSFACGRNIYSLSRAGYFPTAASVTNARTQTPDRALLSGSGMALLALLVIWYLGGKDDIAFMGGFLVSMIGFAGMVSYLLQSISFIRLRKRFPGIHRPFVSPLGNFGAYFTILVCIVTLGYLFINPVYQWAAVTVLVWYLIGLAYFMFYRRHHLILSPEEEFAVSGGVHGRTIEEVEGELEAQATGSQAG